jgi:hypothetical protein
VCSAAAECMAGAFVSGASLREPAPYLLALGSAALFAAGSLLGHFFDREQDAARNPGAPLPSGRVPVRTAWWTACGLLVLGLALCAGAGRDGALGGLGVALAVAVYASTTKNTWGAGFLTLGAARGLNLLLGFTAGPVGVGRLAALALPVVIYAAGWALLRTLRQPGAPPTTGYMSLLHLAAGMGLLLYQAGMGLFLWLDALAFLMVLLALCFPRIVRAVMDPREGPVREGVQYGFLGLTLLEAALAGGHAGVLAGVVVGAAGFGVYAALRRWPISLVTWRR